MPHVNLGLRRLSNQQPPASMQILHVMYAVTVAWPLMFVMQVLVRVRCKAKP